MKIKQATKNKMRTSIIDFIKSIPKGMYLILKDSLPIFWDLVIFYLIIYLLRDTVIFPLNIMVAFSVILYNKMGSVIDKVEKMKTVTEVFMKSDLTDKIIAKLKEEAEEAKDKFSQQ